MLSEFKSTLAVTMMLSLGSGLYAQKEVVISLQNPSFEDMPSPSRTPNGWYSCGQVADSPPDVQPGSFGVTKAPAHGSSYMGLVVRDDETWESVGQRLSRPLEKDQCYEMSMSLCRAEEYKSQSRKTGEPANFATPAKLIIWGGDAICQKSEVLFETSIITNTRWLTYNFRFHPQKGNYSYIMFEAYYKTPVLFPFNGNILLDNASSIKQVACNPDVMPLAAKPREESKTKVETKGQNPPVKVAPIAKADPPKPKTQDTPVPPSEKIGKNLKKDRIYRLDKVYFDANKYDLKPEGEDQLTELYTLMKNNPEVIIEVGGHTNNNLHPHENKAIELSTLRAKSVADWLIAKGIASNRVQYVGYGWKKPIEPNTTPEGRKKNQRVEVKILVFNG